MISAEADFSDIFTYGAPIKRRINYGQEWVIEPVKKHSQQMGKHEFAKR